MKDCLLLPLALAACPDGLQERFEFSQPHMGVPFRVVLHAGSEEEARRAAQAAMERVAELDRRLSNYDTDSELSLLGTAAEPGAWVEASEDLYRVLDRAQDLARRSGGAFDITVGPVAAAWRHARRARRLPPEEQLQRFMARVGWQRLRLDPQRRRARLEVPGMRLDPGGIAKGDALDQALEVLERHGIASALVEAGGDIAVSAPPPGKAGWRIQLPPTSGPDPGRTLLLSRQAVATSGDLHQSLDIGGVRYSHIVDPRTGLGLTERRLVTVIAPSGILADGLATALSVLGEEGAGPLLEAYPGSCARILAMDGEEPAESLHGGFDRFHAPRD